MMESQRSILMSQRSESFCDGQSSCQMSRIDDGERSIRMMDYFQLKSPLPEVNKAAQQHFNNKTISNHHQPSDPTNSESNLSYKQRSILSPGVQRQFSEIDEFLKQTYEKHGIYDLIRQFVDMQDQLVSTFEYLKKLQMIKNGRDQTAMKEEFRRRVSSFEEINQVDEFSFQAEENIIHEFLYNLQQFFIPKENNTNKKLPQQQSEQSSSVADYSFSAQKPQYENTQTNNIINTSKKNMHIHTSRSKQAIFGGGLRSKRNVFTDEKMIQSISICNNRPIITPLKFDDMVGSSSSVVHNNNKNITSRQFYNQRTQSIRKTNSQIIGQQSIESENYHMIPYQQQLLKTIFQLRQQILTLKQQKFHQHNTTNNNSTVGLNGLNNSAQSSFILDGSLVLNEQLQLKNFKQNSYYQNQQQNDDSLLLDSSRENLGLMLGCGNNGSFCCQGGNNTNGYRLQHHQQRTQPIIINSYTQPLIIKQVDTVNQQSSQSHSTSTFKLDMLDTVKQEQQHYYDKENDPNCENVLEKYFSNEKPQRRQQIKHQRDQNKNNISSSKYNSKHPQLLLGEFDKIVKTQSNFITQSCYPIISTENNNPQFPKQRTPSQSQTLSNFKTQTNLFIQKFFDDFKLFFKTEMQIQLILLSMIKKKKTLRQSVFRQFHKMIEWYSQVRISRGTRMESVEKFTWECLKLKGGILEGLKRSV